LSDTLHPCSTTLTFLPFHLLLKYPSDALSSLLSGSCDEKLIEIKERKLIRTIIRKRTKREEGGGSREFKGKENTLHDFLHVGFISLALCP
jgi:hypothetical protein